MITLAVLLSEIVINGTDKACSKICSVFIIVIIIIIKIILCCLKSIRTVVHCMVIVIMRLIQ